MTVNSINTEASKYKFMKTSDLPQVLKITAWQVVVPAFWLKLTQSRSLQAASPSASLGLLQQTVLLQHWHVPGEGWFFHKCWKQEPGSIANLHPIMILGLLNNFFFNYRHYSEPYHSGFTATPFSSSPKTTDNHVS